MSSKRGGLLAILVATAVGGGLGYAVQALVPVWLRDPTDYLQFSVFWATTFLLVSMLSGLQQETSRAVRPRAGLGDDVTLSSSGAPGLLLVRAGAVVAGVIAVAVPISSTVWGPMLFTDSSGWLVGAMTLALVGYVMIAVLSGEFYGLARYEYAAATTIADATLRTLFVLTALTLGMGLVPVAFGVALPFGLSALVLWGVSRRGARGRYYVDVDLPRFLRNSTQAMLAALATGVLISGLPMILRLTSPGLGDQTLAALLLALTLTRAPLVVPLLALQSYLTVAYRNAPERAAQRAVKLAGGVLAVCVVAAALVWWRGHEVLQAIYGEAFALDGASLALVVFSGGATAALCVIAPALLAKGSHGQFLLGWSAAALATVVLLLLIGSSLIGAIIAIATGPLVGCVLCIALVRSGRTPTTGHALGGTNNDNELKI